MRLLARLSLLVIIVCRAGRHGLRIVIYYAIGIARGVIIIRVTHAIGTIVKWNVRVAVG